MDLKLETKQVLAAMSDIERLKAENEALRLALKGKERTVTVRVSKGGGISVYGLGKFPTTLFVSQWEKVLSPDTIAKIRALYSAEGVIREKPLV